MVKDIRRTSYKAFNQDMTCRGFQYEVGKEYEMDGEKLKLCFNGFHSCLCPMNVTRYYNAFTSRFAEVEYWGVVEKDKGSTKICSSNIKVVRELSLKELVELQISWVKDHCTTTFLTDNDIDCQCLYINDCFGIIKSSGNECKIASTDTACKITSSGSCCIISSQGRFVDITSSGDHCFICSLEKYAKITTSGFRCDVYSTGNYANIVSSGKRCRIDSQGYFATITCMGEEAWVKAQIGSTITIANYTYDDDICNETITCVKTEKVDGERIKANTWYKMCCGMLVEVEMLK